jgi:polysaccharide export outer membrane protein
MPLLHKIRFLLLLVLLPMMAGCARRTGDIAYNQANFTAPDAPPAAVMMADYKLSPGDIINVRVFELETLTGDQTIDVTGRVTFPLIGQISADGRTTSELQGDIAAKLRERYLQSPNVVVSLKAAVPRTVTVDGAVTKPGVYAIAPATTLIQTIALAQGLNTGANAKRVIIFRTIDGTRRAAAFDMTSIRNGTDPDPRIYPSDVVVVDGSVLGENYRLLLRSIPLVGLFARF